MNEIGFDREKNDRQVDLYFAEIRAEQRGFLRGLFAGVMLALGVLFAWRMIFP